MQNQVKMTPARKVALAIGVPLALIAVGGTSAATIVAVRHRASIAAQPMWQSAAVQVSHPAVGHQLSLDVTQGQLSLTGATAGMVIIDGTEQYPGPRTPTIAWLTTAGGTTISPSCGTPGGCTYNYDITAPAAFGANLSTSTGPVSVTGMAGPITVSSGGDVALTKLTGSLNIACPGNITASGLAGPAVLFQDGSNSVTASGLSSPDVTVDGSNGDITLNFTAVPRDVQINDADGNGNVTIVLPRGTTPYNVSVNNQGGTTYVEVPVSAAAANVISVTTSGSVNVTIEQEPPR